MLKFTSYKKLLRHKDIVKNIYVRKREILPNKQGHEALCYLDDSLIIGRPHYELHSSADGMGTSQIEAEALYKSISEALERWAYSCSLNDKNLRFDIVPGTSGFAAYPNIFKNYSKYYSLYEGFERWALISFWNNDIDLFHERDKQSAYYYSNDFRLYFVIVYFNYKGKYVYGFSAHKNKRDAERGAQIECFRNTKVINILNNSEYSEDKLSLSEQRLIYFSKRKGHEEFLIKLNSKTSKSKLPKMIVQKEVCGPWSQFTTVYRTVFNCSDLILSKCHNIFKF